MSNDSSALAWCPECDVEFPDGRTRCPVCRELNRNDRRSEGTVAFLFRNLSDKHVPLFRIHRSRGGISRDIWKVFWIMFGGTLLVSCGHIHFAIKDGMAPLKAVGLILLCDLFIAMLLGFIILCMRHARPLDILSDGRMRIPIPGRAPHGAVGLVLKAAERATTASGDRNAIFLDRREWTTALIQPSSNGRTWVFAWANGVLAPQLFTHHFPELPDRLQRIEAVLSSTETARS